MKKPLAWVTDHAVLRYIERKLGIDVEAARLEIGHIVDKAVEAGAGAAVIDGCRYVMDGRIIITVTPVKSVPLRHGRARRQRDLPDGGGE
jgi:hypothetical protein